MPKINCQQLQKAIDVNAWDLSNEILYRMCREHPLHENDEEIIAKVLIIGRVYSAAIERRKRVDERSSMFYLKRVVPALRKSKIDIWLDSLKDFEYPTHENCVQIIAVHENVTDLFENISGLNKRSLASKYLHFHYPNLFFLYDSRSSKSLRQIEINPIWSQGNLVKYDYAYARFFLRCMNLVEIVSSKCGKYLNPREVDKFLLS